MKRILVAMSGGVDSSVAAMLLKEQGAEVCGVYMKNWINEENLLGDCPWRTDIEDARATAKAIGIDFQVVNFMRDYKERIVDYLLEGYRHGITPNPDVMCNREMKFGVLLDYALNEGFDALATGHYARKRANADGSFDLLNGVDPKKNQDYFLAMLRQDQLARAEFPIGHLTKAQVREIAVARDLPNASKKDSQGICFIGQIRMSDFLRHYLPDEPGEIVDPSGRVLGRHKGLHLYTIGQRRGIGVPSNTDNEFYVVAGKNLETNRLIVAFEKPGSPLLYRREVRLHQISWINRPVNTATSLQARPRYLDSLQEIAFSPTGTASAEVVFESPQRALASGQILALHDGDVVLGAGVYQIPETVCAAPHSATAEHAPTAG